MQLAVDATHLSPVNLGVLVKKLSDELALDLTDLLHLLETEEVSALGFVVVLQFGAVEHPLVVICGRGRELRVDPKRGFSVPDLPDRDAGAALALAEVVVALAVDS